MPNLIRYELAFDLIEYSEKQTPWTLEPLLYRGGSSIKRNNFERKLESGALGTVLIERLEIVKALHQEISYQITKGISKKTISGLFFHTNAFYRWADEHNKSPCMKSIHDDLSQYIGFLIHRHRIVRNLTLESGYTYATGITNIFTLALEKNFRLLLNGQISTLYPTRYFSTIKDMKLNLDEVKKFGFAVFDIANSLTLETICGELPVKISFRNGKSLFEKSSGLMLDAMPTNINAHRTRRCERARENCDISDIKIKRRWLVNLKIQAEMALFIMHTSINLEQAQSVKFSNFRYQSHNDEYKVFRVHKGRKHGEVQFTIYSEYRTHFEEYLRFIKTIYGEDYDGILFPRITQEVNYKLASSTLFEFSTLEKRLSAIGVKFIGARNLRNIKVNWSLRELNNPELSAEMAQHSKEVHIEVYGRPSHQRAIVDISNFHTLTDPSIASPGPGVCIQPTPSPILNKPDSAPNPNCSSPSGCLFCVNHKDLDTKDYIWSLASYRYLKTIELAGSNISKLKNDQHPAYLVIDLITNKLTQYKESSTQRSKWVEDALKSNEDNDFHPMWEGFILLAVLK